MLLTQKPDNIDGLSPNVDSEGSGNGSPASASKLTPNRVMLHDMKDSRRSSVRRKDNASSLNSFPGRTQAGDLFSVTVGGHQLPPVRSQILVIHIAGKAHDTCILKPVNLMDVNHNCVE